MAVNCHSKPPRAQMLDVRILRRPERRVFPNGTRACLLKLEHTPILRLDFQFAGGQWLQSHPLQARFAFQMLREGTRSYSACELAEHIDRLGATVEASANLSYSHLTVYCLRKHLSEMLPILLSMLDEPSYDGNKFRLTLSQAHAAFMVGRQRVDTVCREQLFRYLYGSAHPMGQLATEEDYASLTTRHLQAFHARNVHSRNCVLYVTGGYEDEDVARIVEMLGTNAWGGTSAEMFAGYDERKVVGSPERNVIHRMSRPTVQASVMMGCLLPAADHADTPYLRLATTILGGYFGSRLMTSIRETHGYTYDIHGTMLTLPHGSVYVIQTETPNECASRIGDEIRTELMRMMDEPVGEGELENVKNYMMGSYMRRYEVNLGFPSLLMGLVPTHRTLDGLEHECRMVREATAEDVQRVAKHYFSLARFMECMTGTFPE